MKGVILHGGAGTRLRPLTFSGPKQLIPVANKPVSQYALEDLVNCGINEIAIILGETFPELVEKYYGDGSRFGAKITYIHQGKPLGIAHAVGLCRDFIKDDNFVVYLGDNLLQFGIKKYLEEFLRKDADSMVLLKEVEDPTKFGVAEFDEKGKLSRVIEKPKKPPSKYALVGVYFFKSIIFKMIDNLKPSWRGEYEITDAIQMMIDENYKVEYSIVEGWWLDTGKKDDILYANALILDERIKKEIKGEIEDSKINGRVVVEERTKIIKSEVRGPSIIGKNCIIENSFIGPYTSIGDNTKIVNSSIEHSIILENSIIENIERLDSSLVGKNSKIIKNKDRRTLRLNVGDHSEVEVF